MKNKKIIYGILSAMVIASAGLLYYFNFLHDSGKIDPPLSLQIPYDTLTFRAEDGIKYHHFTGSNVVIPEQAFVDKDGFPVVGNVSVVYREFHSPEDILLSGIPMGKMNDSEKKAMQSAGMFQMAAYQGKEELKLADGKKIGVDLAAYQSSDGYSIFELDKSNDWVEKGKSESIDNKKKQDDCAAIPSLPEEPVNPGVNENDMIIETDADYSEYPQFAPFKNSKWKVADVAENKDLKDNLWVFRLMWDKFKIEQFDKPRNLYKLVVNSTFRDYDNKTHSKKYSVVVMPLLQGENLENAMADFNSKMSEYDKLAAQIQKEEDRLALEADALNRFEVDKMGVWNCDRYINEYQFVKIKAQFDFAQQFNPYVNKVKVYVINHTYNTVQDYMVKDWDKIYVRNGSSTSIMAVLPDNKIAVFSKNEFIKVDFDKIYSGSREYHFNTKIYSADVGDKARLKEVL